MQVVLSIFCVILMPFAVWRLSHILIYEDGPFDCVAWFRSVIGVRYNEMSEPYGRNVFAKAFTCMWCLSVWVALIFSWATIYGRIEWIAIIIGAFGLSGLAILIDNCIGGKYG